MAELNYEFLPWARRGLARAHANQQALGAPVLPTIRVGLKLEGSDGAAAASQAAVTLKMLGPADVIGIDPRIVVRVEPRANNHDFEPNYLAVIEFDPPDFPWLLTPARADAQHRLLPWLALVVFKRSEVDGEPRLRTARALPSLVVRAGVALPDLGESWMWAHAQVLRDPPVGDPADVAAALKDRPTRNLSRLVCPRRLEPGESYVACVVPVFDAGRRAGLGQRVEPDATLGFAWAGGATAGIELPVYFHWTFSTGPAGDFETLARRLKAPADDPSLADSVSGLGRERVEIDADHLLQEPAVRQQGAAAIAQAYVGQYEGAMLSLKSTALAEPGRSGEIAADLAAMLNAGEQRALGNLALEDEEPEVPLVGPPVYGAWHARAHSVVPALRARWLHGLNLSVPRRMAAGVGTRVVQAHQEEFMQAAWQQMGDILKAERLLSLAHLSVKSLGSIVERLNHLAPPRRLQFVAPAAARIRSAALPARATTVWGYLQTTSLPDAVAAGGLRRGFAAARPWVRRAERRPADGVAPALLRDFTRPETARALVEVERFRVDGLKGLRALEGVVLPADPAATIDVAGLGRQLPVDVLRGLVERERALQSLKPEAFRRPSVSTMLRTGVLTDAHWRRIGELTARLAAEGGEVVPSRLDLARQLLAAGRGRAAPEGVLLGAVRTARGFEIAPAQGLKVDARNGLVEVSRPVGVRGTVAARAVKPGAIAAVPIGAIRQFGNRALFDSLPAGAIDVMPGGAVAAPVLVDARREGRFVPAAGGVVAPSAPPLPEGGRIGVTTMPAVRDAAVLERFRRAWSARLEREAPLKFGPRVRLDAVVTVRTDQVAGDVARALDVAVQVPRRVQSLIGIAGGRFDYTRERPGVVGRTALSTLEKYVLSQLFDRVMAYPKIDEALSLKLALLDRSAFLPGAEGVPNDSILLLQTNPRFVESFLVGANHEMGREMLWRGFPTDQRGTPFQKFWPYFDPQRRDIQPIHQWNATARLGEAGVLASKPQTVLLIRGQLLRRYPNTNVYAIEKRAGDVRALFDGSRAITLPDGAGTLPPDMSFFLFPIDPQHVANYWFVLEEPMTEPRFGFDDGAAPREVPRVRRRGGGQLMQALAGPAAPTADTWLDVDWADVGTPPGAYLTLAQLRSVPLTPQHQLPAGVVRGLGPIGASAHAAQVATALLQRPFRGYFAGARLAS